ncbi:hypothetical protein LINPERPRIM_LOCUS5409 [Linum perenne]
MNIKRGKLSAAEGEYLALTEAIAWTKQQGLQDVLFETDAKTIVDNLGSADLNQTELGDMMRVCKSILESSPRYAVAYVRRNGNKTAYLLARQACNLSALTEGVDTPIWLQNSLDDICLISH